MPYPYGPSTQLIVNELQTLLESIEISSVAIYKTVIIGGEKDYTNLVPCAVIVLHQDSSERHSMGGTIVEHQDIEIRSVVDYTVASTAETAIIAIRDALMPVLQKYCTLQSTPGVYHSEIKKSGAAFQWMFLKPNWYRIHTVVLEVAQYYVIQGGIQS